MLDDYLKANPGVVDLPWLGIEPQSPILQPVFMVMSYDDSLLRLKTLMYVDSDIEHKFNQKEWDHVSVSFDYKDTENGWLMDVRCKFFYWWHFQQNCVKLPVIRQLGHSFHNDAYPTKNKKVTFH